MSENASQPTPKPDAKEPGPPRIIAASELFRGTREVWIEWAGVRYRLRLTRRNKLILQK
jgi:hemin uptake protein HemP